MKVPGRPETQASEHSRDPLLACTLGDPAGIGPEVLLRALDGSLPRPVPAPPSPSAPMPPGSAPVGAGVLLLGDSGFWARQAARLQLGIRIEPVATAAAAREALKRGETGPWALDCCLVPEGIRPGRPTPECGALALASLEAGAELAESGLVDGLVTAPLSKDLVARRAPRFRGHTEWLAGRVGVADPTMLFAAPRPPAPGAADIALLSTHLPLATALTLIRIDRVTGMLVRLGRQWRRVFGRDPVIGVAALNPHASEAGRLGTEEARILRPAVLAAREAGVDAEGPYPADGVFLRDSLDVILALYHDQGTIMAKRAPWPTVNLTLGLPYVRTSPDHGTAYDRAGVPDRPADFRPVAAAIELAARICRRSDAEGDDEGGTEPSSTTHGRPPPSSEDDGSTG